MAKRSNGFEKNPERAREAGKKSKRGKHLITLLNEILNEKVPDKDLAELKEKYGINKIENNGEAIIREVISKAKKYGDIRALETILKITGEYSEKHQIIGDEDNPIINEVRIKFVDP